MTASDDAAKAEAMRLELLAVLRLRHQGLEEVANAERIEEARAEAERSRPLRVSGNAEAEAIKTWWLEGYKQAATQPYDLGKTLLTFSATTITLTATGATFLKERMDAAAWPWLVGGVIGYVISGVLGLMLVLPKIEPTPSDLQQHYKAHVGQVVCLARWWALLWLAATAVVTLTFLLGRK